MKIKNFFYALSILSVSANLYAQTANKYISMKLVKQNNNFVLDIQDTNGQQYIPSSKTEFYLDTFLAKISQKRLWTKADSLELEVQKLNAPLTINVQFKNTNSSPITEQIFSSCFQDWFLSLERRTQIELNSYLRIDATADIREEIKEVFANNYNKNLKDYIEKNFIICKLSHTSNFDILGNESAYLWTGMHYSYGDIPLKKGYENFAFLFNGVKELLNKKRLEINPEQSKNLLKDWLTNVNNYISLSENQALSIYKSFNDGLEINSKSFAAYKILKIVNSNAPFSEWLKLNKPNAEIEKLSDVSDNIISNCFNDDDNKSSYICKNTMENKFDIIKFTTASTEPMYMMVPK